MNSGIWKKLCFIIAAAGFAISMSAALVSAQDGFREFDRNMMLTPSELFQALSTLQPSERQKQIAAQRRKELEKKGRKLLSNLSPEDKEKAWETAKKFFRKNGVDSASSKSLMDQFGLPPELQKELSEQFRKYNNRPSDPNAQPEENSDKEISEILRKARDGFLAGAPNDGKGVAPSDLSELPKPDADGNDGKRNQQDAMSDSNREREPSKPVDVKSKQSKSDGSNRPGQKIDRGARRENRTANSNDKRRDSQAEDAELPSILRTPKQTPNIKRENKIGQPTQRPATTSRRENFNNQRPDRPSPTNPLSNGNLDLEKVIEQLAESGTAAERSDRSPNADANPLTGSGIEGVLDPAQLEKLKSFIEKRASRDPLDRNRSGSANNTNGAQQNAQSKGWGQRAIDMAKSNEGIGTRFDRLLVKAAERTLKSKDEDGISNGVGSVLGNLVERLQETASKDDIARKQAAGTNSNQRGSGGQNNSYSAGNQNRANSNSNNSNGGWNSNPKSVAQSNPSLPDSPTPSFDPRKMLDSIPDVSSINATQVFTFFAIIGFLLFVGYLLAQSFVGDEATVKKRKVIKQIRETKIHSPRDLVETVDTFLLGKFGIKSSWWNARLAQRVLNSGSPEFQTRVDELIQDYVRARYMRDDIQIPAADQERYKKTLEELSLLDIKPESDLGYVPSHPFLLLLRLWKGNHRCFPTDS